MLGRAGGARVSWGRRGRMRLGDASADPCLGPGQIFGILEVEEHPTTVPCPPATRITYDHPRSPRKSPLFSAPSKLIGVLVDTVRRRNTVSCRLASERGLRFCAPRSVARSTTHSSVKRKPPTGAFPTPANLGTSMWMPGRGRPGRGRDAEAIRDLVGRLANSDRPAARPALIA